MAEVATDNGFRVTARTPLQDILVDRNFNSSNCDLHPTGNGLLTIDRQGGMRGARDLVWIQNWPEILRTMSGGD